MNIVRQEDGKHLPTNRNPRRLLTPITPALLYRSLLRAWRWFACLVPDGARPQGCCTAHDFFARDLKAGTWPWNCDSGRYDG
jgi:hypothetical protein